MSNNLKYYTYYLIKKFLKKFKQIDPWYNKRKIYAFMKFYYIHIIKGSKSEPMVKGLNNMYLVIDSNFNKNGLIIMINEIKCVNKIICIYK